MGGRLSLALSMAMLVGVTFMNISATLDVLIKAYSVDFAGISILMGALFWTHALGQVPAGMVVDRLGLKKVIFSSFFLIVLGNLVSACQASDGLAVAGRIIAGLGTGLGFPAIFKMFGIYAPAGLAGRYQAYFGGFFSLGCIVAYLGLPPLAEMSWRWAYLLPGLAGVPLTIWAYCMDFSRDLRQPAALKELGGIFSSKVGWITGLYHALSWGAVLAIGSWLPSLLAEVSKRSDSADFAWAGALLMLLSGISRISGGMLLGRVPAGLIANGSLALNALLFLLLYLTGTPWAVLTLVLGAIILASINFGGLFQIATQAGSGGSLATFLGFVNFLGNLGGLTFTLVFGFFKDQLGSFGAGFIPMFFFCLLALLLGGRMISRHSA